MNLKSKIICTIFIFTIIFFLFKAISKASGEGALSNSPVTVTYYDGLPSSRNDDYETAIANKDVSINKVEFKTKSIGRLSWGEADTDGHYPIYFDAADVHNIAIALNEAGKDYEKIYELYQKAAKSLYD